MKHLFVLLLAAIPFATTAQKKSYDSLLDEGKIWTIKSVIPGFEESVDYIEYKLMQDTSIVGVSYKQLFVRYKWEYESDWGEWEWLFNKAYIGEDNNGKVYYNIDNGYSIRNDVTMDFSLQVGDVFELNEEDEDLFVVTAVSDTILENSIDRMPRKCIHLSLSINGETLYDEWARDVWIEGIGSVKKGVMGTNGSGGTIQQLIKCTQQDNVIYQYDDETSVQGIKQQPLDDVPIYNLAGQKVDASYKGIVIQNGKKRIVR